MVRILLFLLFLPFGLFSQSSKEKLQQLEKSKAELQTQLDALDGKIESAKMEIIRDDLREFGLPKLEAGEKLIEHSAMMLVYSEEHEQAKWVAHIIIPEVTKGNVGRTNDFRKDPLVETESAGESDYFLKKMGADSTYEYDGFGFDRGHLAPSADFRWSATALSESYFYSNMSPQRPEFNRGIWASLEGAIRGYIAENPNTQLYVVTGPVLHDQLPKSPRSPNKVSVPEKYFKVVVDLQNATGIAYLLPNEGSSLSIESFVKTIDEIESETGLDFFHKLEDGLEERIESKSDAATWIPDVRNGDREPISPGKLKSGQVNTNSVKAWKGDNREISVVGHVVGARYSSKGNVLLNLDKKYPNQIFTVFIRKGELVNFSYDPVKELLGKTIVVKSKVVDLSGLPAMFLTNEKQIQDWKP